MQFSFFACFGASADDLLSSSSQAVAARGSSGEGFAKPPPALHRQPQPKQQRLSLDSNNTLATSVTSFITADLSASPCGGRSGGGDERMAACPSPPAACTAAPGGAAVPSAGQLQCRSSSISRPDAAASGTTAAAAAVVGPFPPLAGLRLPAAGSASTLSSRPQSWSRRGSQRMLIPSMLCSPTHASSHASPCPSARQSSHRNSRSHALHIAGGSGGGLGLGGAGLDSPRVTPSHCSFVTAAEELWDLREVCHEEGPGQLLRRTHSSGHHAQHTLDGQHPMRGAGAGARRPSSSGPRSGAHNTVCSSALSVHLEPDDGEAAAATGGEASSAAVADTLLASADYSWAGSFCSLSSASFDHGQEFGLMLSGLDTPGHDAPPPPRLPDSVLLQCVPCVNRTTAGELVV